MKVYWKKTLVMTALFLSFGVGFFPHPAQALVIIVSDVDDTIRMSNVTNRRAFFSNQINGQKPFKELLEIYHELQKSYEKQGEEVIFFYLTGAPTMFQTVSWLNKQGAPKGIIKNKPYGVLLKKTSDFKFHTLSNFICGQQQRLEKENGGIRNNEPMSILLFGDNGQFDPYVYQGIIERYPQTKAYIRLVISEKRDLNHPQINYFLSEKELLNEHVLRSHLRSEFVEKILETKYENLVPFYVRKNMKINTHEEYEKWYSAKYHELVGSSLGPNDPT